MATLGQYGNPYLDKFLASEPGSEYNTKSNLGGTQPVKSKGYYIPKDVGESSSNDKPFYDDAKEVGRQVLGGAVVDLPKMVGQAAQYVSPNNSPVSKWGKKVVDSAKSREGDYTPDLEGRGGVAEMLIKGGRALPPSVATLVPYAAGPVVGTAATIALFGGSQAQETLEKGKEKGLSDSEANQAALMTGLVQGGGEALANKLSLGLLGAGKKGIGAVLKGGRVAEEAVAPFLKAYGKALVGETATENAQDLSTEAIERAYGIGSGQSYSDIAKETTKATIGLTTLLAPFGIIGHYKNSQQAKAINEIMDNPNHDQGDRLKVISKVANDLHAQGVKGVDEWFRGAAEDIKNGVAVRRSIDPTKEEDLTTNKNFVGTQQAITNGKVRGIYNKFNDTFSKIQDNNDPNYKSVFDAATKGLNDLLNPGEGKTVDPILKQEAERALNEIKAAHESRARTDSKTKQKLEEEDKPFTPEAPNEFVGPQEVQGPVKPGDTVFTNYTSDRPGVVTGVDEGSGTVTVKTTDNEGNEVNLNLSPEELAKPNKAPEAFVGPRQIEGPQEIQGPNTPFTTPPSNEPQGPNTPFNIQPSEEIQGPRQIEGPQEIQGPVAPSDDIDQELKDAAKSFKYFNETLGPDSEFTKNAARNLNTLVNNRDNKGNVEVVKDSNNLSSTEYSKKAVSNNLEKGNYTSVKLKTGEEVKLVNIQDFKGDAIVAAFDSDGNRIGILNYTHDMETTPSVFVNEDWRRKGVATALYDLANKTGGKINSDPNKAFRSEDGEAFRKSYDKPASTVTQEVKPKGRGRPKLSEEVKAQREANKPAPHDFKKDEVVELNGNFNTKHALVDNLIRHKFKDSLGNIPVQILSTTKNTAKVAVRLMNANGTADLKTITVDIRALSRPNGVSIPEEIKKEEEKPVEPVETPEVKLSSKDKERLEEIDDRLDAITELVNTTKLTSDDKEKLRKEASRLIGEKFHINRNPTPEEPVEAKQVEAIITIDPVQDEVIPELKVDALKKEKENKVSLDSLGYEEEDTISEFSEEDLSAYEDQIDSLTKDIESDSPGLTPEQETKLDDLRYQLEEINAEIKELDEWDDGEDLKATRSNILKKIAELEGQVFKKNKKVSKKNVSSQIDIDEEGNESFDLPEWAKATVESKVDHSANRDVFDKIKAGLKSSNISNGLIFEYIEDFAEHDWSKTPITPNSTLKTARGVYRKHGENTYVFINGARHGSTKDMIGTIGHELLGHYGVRKLFDRKDGGNDYDKFLASLFNNKDGGLLKQEILANTATTWNIYLDNWKRLNISNYQSMTSEERFAAYKAKILSLPEDQRVTFKTVRNGKEVNDTIPMSIAVKLADEYIAELAKAKTLNPAFIKGKVGLGGVNSESRTMLRRSRERWLNNVLDKVKHFFKKMFGNHFDSITKDDLTMMIAESYDSLFENINPREQFISNKPFVNKTGRTISYEGIDNPTLAEAYDSDQYSLGGQTRDFKLFNDLNLFSNSFLSEFGNHTDTVKGRFHSKLLNAARNNPVLKVFTTFGNMQEQEMYKAIPTKAKGYISAVEKSTLKMVAATKNLSPTQNQLVFEYFTTPNASLTLLDSISSQEQKDAIIEAKKNIREMGQMMVDAGIIPESSYQANYDAYLHVQYMKFIKQYRGSGKRPSIFSFSKKRKTRNEMEALAMGQIKDVRFLVPETYGVMARDLVLVEMFNTINQVSNLNQLHWVLTGSGQVRWGNKRMSLDQAHKQLNDNKFILEELSRTERTKYFIASQMMGQSYDEADEQNAIRTFQAETDALANQIEAVEDRFVDNAYRHAIQNGLSSSVTREQFLKDNYTRLPVKKQLGQLSNRYVRKEIAADLEAYSNMWDTSDKSKIERFFAPNGTLERIHRFWKWTMVALNPGSWVRNAFGNFSLLDLSTSTSSPKLMGMLFDEISNVTKGNPSEFWQLADRYGLFGTTLSAVELKDTFDKYIDELDAAKASYERRTGTSWDHNLIMSDERMQVLLKVFAEISSKTKGVYHKANNKTSEWFAFLEGSFKTVAFRDYIQTWEKENKSQYPNGVRDLQDHEKDVLYSKAANHANDAIFDYSQIPSMVRSLRRIPFGAPFLTFTYKSFPLMVKAMVRQPVKFAKYATLPFFLTTLAMIANNWDDDDIRRLRHALPDYYRMNSGTAFLPIKDSTGKPQIIPLDYLIPWSQWTTAARHINDNYVNNSGENITATTLESVGTLFKQLGFLGGPTPSALAAMLSGQDTFMGKSIVTPGASPDQQLMEIMGFGANMMLPAWLTSHGWFSKMHDAGLTGDRPVTNRFGEVKFTPTQAVANITGFGPVGVQEKGGTFNRSKFFDKRLDDINEFKHDVAKNKGLDYQEKANKIREANERIKLIRRQQMEERKGGNILDRF